jgi:tRNA threonylcarbamoyladenosine modification (KEOPS) complex Cgi121 subunit
LLFTLVERAAKTLGLEWLCRMAGTGNVSTAIGLCLPPREKGAVVGIARVRKIEGAEIAELGEPIEVDFAALEKKAAALFKVSKNELANNTLEDLLIERAALAAVA